MTPQCSYKLILRVAFFTSALLLASGRGIDSLGGGEAAAGQGAVVGDRRVDVELASNNGTERELMSVERQLIHKDSSGIRQVGTRASSRVWKPPGAKNSNMDLRNAPVADADGHCTWEALSRSSAGSWQPTHKRPGFDERCPYMKDRYKCDWDRGWKHTKRWIPDIVSSGQCALSDTHLWSMSAKLGRRLNVVILGNSLLRELYETIACANHKYVASYTNLGWKDNFSITSTPWMELVYVFGLGTIHNSGKEFNEFLRKHHFGRGLNRTASRGVHNEIDVLITNYGMDIMDPIYADMFAGQRKPPVVIYSSHHACARTMHAKSQLPFVAEHRDAGRPIFDLCTMSKAAVEMNYDVQARKEGRTGDPHLCMPGPHVDAMKLIFQMMADLLTVRDTQ